MPPTDRERGVNWRDVFDITVTVATVGLMVWMLCPGLQVTVKGWVTDWRDGWRARDVRERVEAEMASEVWHVRRVLEEGGDIERGLGLAS